MDLQALRRDFDLQANYSMSMPIAGTIMWLLIALAGIWLPFKTALLFMLFATGMIFPVALLIARLRNEKLFNNGNPLAKLMGMCVLMVNLLWVVHIPLLLRTPELLPLSLGMALGLHWIVFSWIIAHPLGMVHAVLRALLLLMVWLVLPQYPVTATGAVIVFCYLITLAQMKKRAIENERVLTKVVAVRT